jgi:hypothetical protein
LLIFALAVHVPVVYLSPDARHRQSSFFIGSLYESGWFLVYLRLWFLGHLLIYSLAYAICRQVVTQAGEPAGLGRHPGRRQSWRSLRCNMVDGLALRLVHGELPCR